jgi:hypothetical protein
VGKGAQRDTKRIHINVNYHLNAGRRTTEMRGAIGKQSERHARPRELRCDNTTGFPFGERKKKNVERQHPGFQRGPPP